MYDLERGAIQRAPGAELIVGRIHGSALGLERGSLRELSPHPLMPEAYEHGGNLVGLFTALGFATAFFVKTLE